MTDRAQFEAMLEALINDDTDQAKEIFHNIVVSKSREIYEELLAEDFSKDTGNPYDKNDDDDMEESDDPTEEGDDEEDMPDEEGDSEDDMDMDMDMGDEEGEEGSDMEDRVMDLEDALEDLKAEFEQLLSQEDEESDDMGGMDDMGGDMGGDMDSEMDEMDATADDVPRQAPVMEYYKKVSVSHGDNGTNTKSIVAGKNDMGGTTANIAKSFSTTSGGTTGGLAKNTAGDLTKGMNVHNRVQSNAGKTAFKKSEPGHGPEKAGKKETADNKQSMLNGAPKRAK